MENLVNDILIIRINGENFRVEDYRD